jgi:hypothetical protein
MGFLAACKARARRGDPARDAGLLVLDAMTCTLTGTLTGVPTGALTGTLTGVLAGALTGTLTGVSTGVLTDATPPDSTSVSR